MYLLLLVLCHSEYDKGHQATPYDPERSELVTELSGVQELSTDQLVVGNIHHRAHLELVGRPNGECVVKYCCLHYNIYYGGIR